MPLKKGLNKKRKRAQLMGGRNTKIMVDDDSTAPLVQPDDTNLDENNNLKIDKLTNKSNQRTLMAKELLGLTNVRRKRPQHTCKDSGNRIVHWDSLKSLISSNMVCKMCGSDVNIGEKTVGIATQVVATCKNRHCGLLKKIG